MLRLMDLNPTNKEIKEMVNNFKPNNYIDDTVKFITYEEFLICIARKRRESDSVEELLSCFRFLDKDATGKIPEPTLRYYLCHKAEMFTDEEMDLFMKEATQFTEIINEVKFLNYPNHVLYLKDKYTPPEEVPVKGGKGKGKK